jgi:hypothetical protein
MVTKALDGPEGRLRIARMPKAILLALLAACGVHSGSESAPDEQPLAPPDTGDDVQEDQHFCCKQVNQEKLSGEDCVTIPKESIDFCAEVLFCSGDWSKSGGVVKCSK